MGQSLASRSNFYQIIFFEAPDAGARCVVSHGGWRELRRRQKGWGVAIKPSYCRRALGWPLTPLFILPCTVCVGKGGNIS